MSPRTTGIKRFLWRCTRDRMRMTAARPAASVLGGPSGWTRAPAGRFRRARGNRRFSLTSTHPYIPNAAPETRRAMLERIGIDSLDELFASIPQRLRAPEDLGLPPALPSESQLRRYFADALAGDANTSDHLAFLGGGCWKHAVPAVCDEIAGRGEFTSAFMGLAGSAATGAYQALFEYQSLMSELLGLDITPLPAYDWAWAASTALLMATRVTDRTRVLPADTAGPDRRRQIMARLPRRIEVESVGHDERSGSTDLDDLAERAEGAAALY